MAKYEYFQGKRVSVGWFIILTAAWEAGVRFRLNSGQRTIAEQWDLYNAYLRGSGVLAAYPSGTAPHIRNPNHAIDVDSSGNGENELQAWLRAEGVAANNTVAGEAWHLELTDAGYRLLVDRYSKTHNFPQPARRWIREYDRLKRQGKRRARRGVLRLAMRRERKKFYKSKTATGRAVYAALLNRSR